MTPHTANQGSSIGGGFDFAGFKTQKQRTRRYAAFLFDFSDKLLVEGFLRAGLNYCANRSAYMCYCELDEISDVLTHLGFENNNGVYSGDIPTLLKGSCCK